MGHDGRRLTLADLPRPETIRWVIRRKAKVVAAVRGGVLSLEEACGRYTLNTDEFRSWEFCIDHYGLAGVRTTHSQFYFNSMLSLTLANLGSARESLFCRVNGYGAEFCHCLGLAVTVKKLTRPVFPASNDANPLNFWPKSSLGARGFDALDLAILA